MSTVKSDAIPTGSVKKSKYKNTLNEMKRNASAYGMLAPFFFLFAIFTIIPL